MVYFPGWSGADLTNLCDVAARAAVYEHIRALASKTVTSSADSNVATQVNYYFFIFFKFTVHRE